MLRNTLKIECGSPTYALFFRTLLDTKGIDQILIRSEETNRIKISRKHFNISPQPGKGIRQQEVLPGQRICQRRG